MNCPQCGEGIRVDEVFCPSCGHRIPRGEGIRVDEVLRPSCGHRIPHPISPIRFILSRRLSPVGIVVTVSIGVIFAAIIGFTLFEVFSNEPEPAGISPHRLPNTDVFLLRQTFRPSPSPTLPDTFKSKPFSEWPEPMAVIKQNTNFVFWAYVLDVTQEAEDFQMDGFVRWVDVTYPDHPLVMLEGPVQLVGDVAGETVEVPRSHVVPSEVDTGEDVEYRTLWHGLGHQNKPSLWQPGLYLVQLLDDRHKVLFHWQFEVK